MPADTSNFKNTFQPEQEADQEPSRHRNRGDGKRWIYATPGALNPNTFHIVAPEAFSPHEQDELISSPPPQPLSPNRFASPEPPPSPLPPPRTGRPQRSTEGVQELIRTYGSTQPPENMDEMRWLEERERLQEQGVLPLTDEEMEPTESIFRLRPVSPPMPPSPPSPPQSPRSLRKAQLKTSKATANTKATTSDKSKTKSKPKPTIQHDMNDREDSMEAEETSEEHLRALLNVGQTDDIGLHSLVDPAPGQRPDYALPTLVKLAIFSSPKKRLTLQEIYQALQDRFEWYRENDAWKVGHPVLFIYVNFECWH